MGEEIGKHPGGRPRLFTSPEELQAKIDEYFKWCDERTLIVLDKLGHPVEVKRPRPYTMSGLALFLEVDRQTLLNYEDRANEDKLFGAVIARARAKCGAFAEEQLFEGNDRGAQFSLMNNYGFKNQVQLDANLSGEVTVKFIPAEKET